MLAASSADALPAAYRLSHEPIPRRLCNVESMLHFGNPLATEGFVVVGQRSWRARFRNLAGGVEDGVVVQLRTGTTDTTAGIWKIQTLADYSTSRAACLAQAVVVALRDDLPRGPSVRQSRRGLRDRLGSAERPHVPRRVVGH